ncbi:MAG: cytochrome c oxidase assembly protein [Alphaproteobacteria bacterium]|nr:cytochrome c oxidase assembly protein [Alphaproteobacteria bacterium]MDE2336319.1 cytochrome c oxidase assembly protein [Alphaproteobacteria bacterium]
MITVIMEKPTVNAPHMLQSAALLAGGAVLCWVSAVHPAFQPVWMPWDFSWGEYLATAFATLWFFRGLAAAAPQERLPRWRVISFLLGLALIYIVLQTHFDFMAQHMFFLDRIQHVIMHHEGPFLIALSGAGETLRRGMPRWVRRIADHRFSAAAVRLLQQPVLAAFLFSGLFYFWLIPAVNFRAMTDPLLYFLMNASMTIDGLLFWTLVLDRRPSPPARVSFAVRAVLSIVVMFPQIILGALMAFSDRDIYPYYNLCGRLYPAISAVTDQHIGGIISWDPPSMMSIIGFITVLNFYRLSEEKKENKTAPTSSPQVA